MYGDDDFDRSGSQAYPADFDPREDYSPDYYAQSEWLNEHEMDPFGSDVEAEAIDEWLGRWAA